MRRFPGLKPRLRFMCLASFLLGPLLKNIGDFKTFVKFVPGLKPRLRLGWGV